MDTRDLVRKYEEEMISNRRHIHENPELSKKEFQTTKFIKEKLAEYGVEVAEIGLETGVVAIVRGKRPGKTVAIREDIDALPMAELTDLPFASQNAGVCHSCGHDIHTAVLLCCARVLSDIKEELAGNVLLLFQPAEETGSGAKELIRCNFMQVAKPDVFIGLHVAPLVPAGCIGVKRGPAGGSADMFKITIKGKGGHGAHPENFVDPIVTAAYVITQLQTVVSRENYPVYPAVLSIGSIHGGTASNIVPDTVEMTGTLRSLNEESRKDMQKAIDRIVSLSCEAMRAAGEVSWDLGLPPLVNDDEVVDRIEAAAEKIMGPGHVVQGKNPSMGSEDFSCLFPEYAPGAQFSLGTGNDNPETRHGIHNGKNVFDESGMADGAAVMVQFARDFLK